MAQKEDATAPAKKGAGAMKKILFITLGTILLVGGSVGATLFLTGALHKGGDAGGERPAAHGKADPGKGHGEGGKGHGAPVGPASIYQALDPPFIINFDDQGVLRYLQIGFTVMAKDQKVIDAVNGNMPQIRNNLILLFGNQKFETLASNEGKEKLRAQSLEQVQTVLNQEIGEPGIEAIYYTIFVMQ